MPNRLAASTSPYLRQHAENPVDWREWGEEAFAEARERDVPILLSVGYSSCHWCHVMAHGVRIDRLEGRIRGFWAAQLATCARSRTPRVPRRYLGPRRATLGSELRQNCL